MFNWCSRSNGASSLVIASKGRFVCTVEIQQALSLRLTESAYIFSIQPGNNTDIPITRGQLFGIGGVLPGSNHADIWRLDMGRLREAAERWIRFTGYVYPSINQYEWNLISSLLKALEENLNSTTDKRGRHLIYVAGLLTFLPKFTRVLMCLRMRTLL